MSIKSQFQVPIIVGTLDDFNTIGTEKLSLSSRGTLSEGNFGRDIVISKMLNIC